MADKKISQLTALAAANLAPSTDVLAIVDTSATETKKIVAQDLINGVLNVASAVGIGTASPGYKLHVVDNSTGTQVRVASSSSGGTSQSFINTATNGRSYRIGSNFVTGTGEFALYDDTAAAARLTVDSSGNLGLGVTPTSAWDSGFKVIQLGGGAYFGQYNNNAVQVGLNTYFNGTNYIYTTTNEASRFAQTDGQFQWFTAPSGTTGNTITFTQALTLDANVNLLLNGTTAPASGVGTFAIFNGTAPTGSVTNGCVLYAEDVSSSSELKVRDEAGNVTTLSPHNFSLIPEGASEDMAWAYYSEKGGKRINVDMLKLARMVEKLTGEKLVYEA